MQRASADCDVCCHIITHFTSLFLDEMQEGTPDTKHHRDPQAGEAADGEPEQPTWSEWRDAEKNAEDVVEQKLAAMSVTAQR